MSLQNSKIIISQIYNKLSSSSKVTNQTSSIENAIKNVVVLDGAG